ncbi:bifunctional diguanylate cyclase/phosphodiesterase [Aurantimonas endophytica]|uniref:Diguanylate cyclase (GGDEF)-like protein/PAS domain S-box-containing protein n=1 Tax=Aurantimonas endophytica TaxID=1522175 RepID=A0A7W6HG48_9HYPH|nr:EAL domain-containing protein [Aurantimonas endophytica]MBB4004600.1 diguanylate cyclase (GGDEF)-like protein/PAS domain S-box-containing protein [Aurantimonas endophytica]MCO6405436.1 EAL domain-containing protein [Aurantimonas endophytica]
MWRVYSCLVYEHDLRFVAIAIVVCVLGSFTSAALLQRAATTGDVQRRSWVILAGIVTGISIWTTHFTAMIGYAQELDLRINVVVALVSAVSAMALSVLGWFIWSEDSRLRRMLGGAVVGVALACAHYMDMAALQVPGVVQYDAIFVVASLAGGVTLCAGAGLLLKRSTSLPLAWPSAVALGSGILCLHFIAMASMTIVRGNASAVLYGVDLGTVGSIVVFTSILIIAVALFLAYQSQNRARVATEDRKRLLKALADLQASEAHHRASIELNPQIAWLADINGGISEISPRWAELVGIPVEQAHGDGWRTPVHPDDLPDVVALWRRAVETGNGGIADTRYRVLLLDGCYRWFRARARPRRAASGEIIAWYGTLEDIDEQVRAELELRRSEERYRLAFRATNDVIWDWSYERRRTTWAGAIEEVLGYPEARDGQTEEWWIERIHPDDRDRVLRLQAAVLQSGGDQWSLEYRFRRNDGEYLSMVSRCLIVRDDNGVPVRLVGSMLNVSEQRRIENELHRAAHEDNLTKLANRRLYALRIDEAIDRANIDKSCVGLVVIDLNNFKSLNDSLGHAAGDAVLCEVADRLRASAPRGATVARLGGDEFAIILPGLTLADAREETVRDVLAGLEVTMLIDGLRMVVSVCAGAAIWPRDADTAGDLLKCADLALYAAKSEHPGAIRGFNPEMRQASEIRATMLSNARLALEDERIIPFYQPKLNLRTGMIVGFEALLRWQDNTGDIRPPASIFAAFEDVELSTRITDCMLQRIIRDCVRWRGEGVEFGRVAFNASAADFRRSDFADRVLRSISSEDLSAALFELEVTESVFIGRSTERVVRTLETLRSEGMTIALDDFGTGYASLTHLQQFPVDVLKIDKSFVSPILADAESGAVVVNAVLQMARSLRIETVAEGVETLSQAEYLRARGCDIAQGYLFGRPSPADRVPALCAASATTGYPNYLVTTP